MGLLKFDFRTVADAAAAASFFFWAAASAVACFFASAADFASAAFAAASTFLASAAFAASCFFAAAASLACLAACGGDRIGLAHDGASEGDSADAAPRLGLLERGVLRRLLRGGRLWGHQPVSQGTETFVNPHAIEQTRSQVNVASMAWGARTLISTQHCAAPGSPRARISQACPASSHPT